MCLEGKGTVTDRGAVEKNDTTRLSTFGNEDVKEAIAWLKETDTGFYRIEKTYREGIASMTSLAQDYSSISAYNSHRMEMWEGICFQQCSGPLTA